MKCFDIFSRENMLIVVLCVCVLKNPCEYCICPKKIFCFKSNQRVKILLKC